MFSGPKPLVLSTSSSPPCLPLGLLPVDLLAAGLDDVEVEVGVGVPDQGELGVADLDLDAPDALAPLAEPGQAEAVAVARRRGCCCSCPRRRSASVAADQARRASGSSELEVERLDRRSGPARGSARGSTLGMVERRVQAAGHRQALLDARLRAGQPRVEDPRRVRPSGRSTRAPGTSRMSACRASEEAQPLSISGR